MSNRRAFTRVIVSAVTTMVVVLASPLLLLPTNSSASGCSVSYGFGITAPLANATVHGPVVLMVGATTPATGVSFAIVGTNGTSGQVQLPAAVVDQMHWKADWASTTLPDGVYRVTASAVFPTLSGGATSTTGTSCQTDPVQITVANQPPAPATTTLVVTPQPATWSGPTNYRLPVRVVVAVATSTGTTTEVSGSATVQWTTTLGTIDGAGSGAGINYFSGPSAGTGQLVAHVYFQGMTALATIPLLVKTVSETAPAPSSSGPATTQPSTSGPGVRPGAGSPPPPRGPARRGDQASRWSPADAPSWRG